VLFGGRSGEHVVSAMSGLAIIEGLKTRYDVVPIGITRSGQFLPGADVRKAVSGGGVEKAGGAEIRSLAPLEISQVVGRLDVVIPALHGPMGEDGTIQGLLELADIPYVGSGVLGSAVSMDKAVMKEVLECSGLPTSPWFLVTETLWREDPGPFVQRGKALSWPVFVKPANMGSSVGIAKVADEDAFERAVEKAFEYDRRVMVEKGLAAREFECAVLGNDHPETSVVGEIVPHADFYDYGAKYGEEGADLVIPAPLAPARSEEIRDLAQRAFLAVDAQGLARVDFFLEGERVYVNEINTLPGFTPFSMYPKLWAATGVPYEQLLDRLIQLALERHEIRRRKLDRGGRNLP